MSISNVTDFTMVPMIKTIEKYICQLMIWFVVWDESAKDIYGKSVWTTLKKTENVFFPHQELKKHVDESLH